MPLHTKEQEYAQGVFQLVSRLNMQSAAAKKYGAFAHQLPVLVRTAGLAQALEFANTRDSDQRQVLEDLAIVLKYSSRDALLQASRNAPLPEYMRLTQETLQALLWFKRYAQSVLDVTSGGE